MYKYFKVTPFPGCCTAVVIHDFVYFGNKEEEKKTEREFAKAINENNAGGLIVATTTDSQIKAGELLRKYGFKRTVFKRKPFSYHPETKLALWWLNPRLKRGNQVEFIG